MTGEQIAELHAIAEQLRRLSPSHRNPDTFHERKSDLVERILAVASLAGNPSSAPRQPQAAK